MASVAPRYDVLRFLGPNAPGYAAEDAHVLVAVAGLKNLVSYDRKTRASTTTNASDGVVLRGPPILIHDGINGAQVQRGKESHVKHAQVTVQGAARDLLRDVFPDDWALLWIVPTRAHFDDLLARVKKGEPANLPEDGLRLLGRVHQVRKQRRTGADGKKNVTSLLQLVGFQEFDSQLYYDMAVATNDVLQQSVGRWLTRLGVDADAWFGRHATDDRADNINTILPQIMELVLGKGGKSGLNPGDASLQGSFGAGAQEDAPNAYTVPTVVGRWLGLEPDGAVLSYADLIDVQVGLQRFKSAKNDLAKMQPSTFDPLSGAFYPFFPEMINTPFWQVLSKFLNPSINEMYTSLRLGGGTDPAVFPTWTVRQIPFTTEAFQDDPPSTRFLAVPRWVIPSSLVKDDDLGRSNATRTNLVHVYGSSLQFAGQNSQSKQIVENPIIHDDLDIQRSGPRPLMLTVECSIDDNRSAESAKWTQLIADRTMGSHLTLSGTVSCVGLPAPIAEGDNVEIDGMVYHVEELLDVYQISPEGRKSWRTILRLTNGVLAESKHPLHYYGVGDGDQPTLNRADPGVFTLERNR